MSPDCGVILSVVVPDIVNLNKSVYLVQIVRPSKAMCQKTFQSFLVDTELPHCLGVMDARPDVLLVHELIAISPHLAFLLLNWLPLSVRRLSYLVLMSFFIPFMTVPHPFSPIFDPEAFIDGIRYLSWTETRRPHHGRSPLYFRACTALYPLWPYGFEPEVSYPFLAETVEDPIGSQARTDDRYGFLLVIPNGFGAKVTATA